MPAEPAPRRRVAITGATGLIGDSIARALSDDGTTVIRIGRGATADIRWDVSRGLLDPTSLERLDAVVHLAGAPIARRWTAGRKREIVHSRVDGTALLARTLAALQRPPRVLLSGSAVGYYGDRGDEWLTESSAPGTGFLATTTVAWEQATQPAAAAGIRVVHLRTGLVLSRHGGVPGKLLTPFRLGLGGAVGHGRQWMSCIGMHDYVRAALFLIRGTVAGPVNLVGPQPVTATEFARTLGHVLSRPSLLPAPAFALRMVFGDMARETLLASQRVRPARLLDAGFSFDDADLASALRRALA